MRCFLPCACASKPALTTFIHLWRTGTPFRCDVGVFARTEHVRGSEGAQCPVIFLARFGSQNTQTEKYRPPRTEPSRLNLYVFTLQSIEFPCVLFIGEATLLRLCDTFAKPQTGSLLCCSHVCKHGSFIYLTDIQILCRVQIPNRKLTVGLSCFAVVALGFGGPLLAVNFSIRKARG